MKPVDLSEYRAMDEKEAVFALTRAITPNLSSLPDLKGRNKVEPHHKELAFKVFMEKVMDHLKKSGVVLVQPTRTEYQKGWDEVHARNKPLEPR